MKTPSISITDFEFTPASQGRYKVRFRGLAKGTKYDCITNDMPLIDATKNAENPKIKDLVHLKRLCKRG